MTSKHRTSSQTHLKAKKSCWHFYCEKGLIGNFNFTVMYLLGTTRFIKVRLVPKITQYFHTSVKRTTISKSAFSYLKGKSDEDKQNKMANIFLHSLHFSDRRMQINLKAQSSNWNSNCQKLRKDPH